METMLKLLIIYQKVMKKPFAEVWIFVVCKTLSNVKEYYKEKKIKKFREKI